ncbi:uncharacterized protein K02A2.6-like [Sabethes cyaneus]|uniref:uncharacterized protein K02A2.6-like n=1 Tax=Sabethes cyaneus TaxID=53552 RepID=UPI00237D7F5F|nr:uncharacterized protein K02A2.6-like [Sabethes cyaneus]
MSSPGRYVRAPIYGSDREHSCESEDSLVFSPGRFVRISSPDENTVEYTGDWQDDPYAHYRTMVDSDRENRELRERVLELEKTITQILDFGKHRRKGNCSPEEVWIQNGSHEAPAVVEPVSTASVMAFDNSSQSIRWDNIKPFPKGVPASKMWKTWTKYYENFEIAASLSNANDPVKRSQLLYLSMGDDLQGIVRAAKLKPVPGEPDCYETFVRNIEEYLKGLTDISAEHDTFTSMYQEEKEPAVSFHARLREKVWLCGYSPSDQDRFVRTQLLKGLKNRKLARAARIYGYETNFVVQSATRDEALQPEPPKFEDPTSIMAVSRSFSRDGGLKRRRRNADEKAIGTKRFRGEVKPLLQRSERCSRCNRASHNGERCPSLDKTCFSCGRRGHFVATCRNKRVNVVQDRRGDSALLPIEDKTQQINALSFEDVLVDCTVGSSSKIKFLIDSGADSNVIGGDDWRQLEKQLEAGTVALVPIEISRERSLRAYAADKPMIVEHAFRANIQAIGSDTPIVSADFLVVMQGRCSLLGRNTASELKLLKVGADVYSCSHEDEDGVFPKMPGVKIKFCVDKSIPPEKNAYFNVPAAYRDAAKLRLQQMEKRGIIEKVLTAPQWISGMSAVPKGKEDFRLVVNMRAPNKAIKRQYFRLPLLDEMRVKLFGAKYFSKLDLSNAYYHLELSSESRDLTTFLTEDGMFRFTRLMFGVNCAPEIFQREMTRILDEVKNKIVYIDDILLFAETLEELRKTVALVLRILKMNNLTLNLSKCEFDKSRIRFLGHELGESGFNIEESKVKDIRKFRQPKTTSELRSFLGLASYVSPYIKNFADISAPLWAVVSSKSWSWGQEQEQAFELVKDRIVRCTASLGYFSENDKSFLYTDASPNALGAVLVQEDSKRTPRIISFASKALTVTEKKYPQNQREALAAVWAVEHFAYFLLGRHFTLRTDARGITFILNRSRETAKRALTRADGWALRLSPYNYDVEFVRGCENIADPSSRLYAGNDEAFDEDSSPWEIAHLEANAIQFLTEKEIKESTARDTTLQRVLDSLETGDWPKELQKFQTISNDLHSKEGMLVKSGCVVIPSELREKTLTVAHAGHPLAAKLKSILRKRVWWPGMAGDAERWVKSCVHCAVNGKPESRTPMERIFAPKAVWDTIAVDFNGPYLKYGGVSILVIIDLRSRYAIARPVKSTAIEHTTNVLNDVFRREGFPKAIKSDNGPPFNGEQYKQYCSDRGIQTIFSTPFFPQQNGLVESFMKVVNKAMSTAASSGTGYSEELQDAVNAYNAGVHSVIKVSPEEVMMGRKIKRGLPLLVYEKADYEDQQLDAKDHEVKVKGKAREDQRRGAKNSTVKPGDTVIVERLVKGKGDSRFNMKRFTVMTEKNGSLLLADDEGHTVKRHVSQTKKVHSWRNSSRMGIEEQAVTEPFRRPGRTTKAPSYLSDYVRHMEDKE